MAVWTVKVVVWRWRRRKCDGDVLWLLLPFLFNFDWRNEQRFGYRRCGPVRLLRLILIPSGDRGRSCRGSRRVALSLRVCGFTVVVVYRWGKSAWV